MKQQTPLRKAIAEIEKQIRDMTGADYVAGICINVIENLLPEERRVIEDVYMNGYDGPCAMQGKTELASDFFTSNFCRLPTQNLTDNNNAKTTNQ